MGRVIPQKEGRASPSNFPQKRFKRCVKKKAKPLNLVLGKYICLNGVVVNSDMTLEGRFLGHRVGEQGLKEWISSN